MSLIRALTAFGLLAASSAAHAGPLAGLLLQILHGG
jgi:hypothetical protein